MEEKDHIESGFRRGVIRVLVATTTLTPGVNLPAQRVIINSPLLLGKTINALTYEQIPYRTKVFIGINVRKIRDCQIAKDLNPLKISINRC